MRSSFDLTILKKSLKVSSIIFYMILSYIKKRNCLKEMLNDDSKFG